MVVAVANGVTTEAAAAATTAADADADSPKSVLEDEVIYYFTLLNFRFKISRWTPFRLVGGADRIS